VLKISCWGNELEGELLKEIKTCCVTNKWEGKIIPSLAVRRLGGKRAGQWDVGCTVRMMCEEQSKPKPTKTAKVGHKVQ
jgi:hypothetical protein